ncbi:MAG: hypothetical protein KA437_05900, partial [Fermentimonas sp.]|nr:hypothetical protein [Fermentimonas sp.]
EDLPTTSVVEIKPSSTYISLRSSQITLPDDGAEVESITLNSLRILVFDKTSGQIVTNKKFDIETVTAVEQTDGSWVADFSDFVAPTNPGQSVVYAVLNEDVSEVSGQSLKTFLDEVTTLTGMQTLVNTPLTYIPLRVVYDTTGKPIEPPFVMVAYDEFDIPANRPITDPFEADLRGLGGDSKGFAVDRTMAKVTISRVTSEPYMGYVGTTDNVKTSYIFILEMGLVNVPQTYLWSPPDYSDPTKYYQGVYQSFPFDILPQDTKYYSRDWTGGDIEASATANVTWTQTGQTDKRIYKVQDNNGVNSYSTTFNPNVTFTGTSPTGNQGNFPTFMQTYFADGAGTGFNLGDLEFTNTKVTPTVTGAYWTLEEENISYYIPENILQTKTSPTNSTKLHVKAAIASIEIDATNVDFDQDSVKWVMSGNQILWTYPSSTEYTNLVTDAFHFYSKNRYDAEGGVIKPEYIDVLDPGSRYIHFWDGSVFWRKATGTVSTTLVNPDFSKIDNSNYKQDFYLPIRNNVSVGDPADYNIYRNNEYKFSVHVLEQWPLSAPSGAPSQSSTRSAWEDPNQSMVLRIVPE